MFFKKDDYSYSLYVLKKVASNNVADLDLDDETLYTYSVFYKVYTFAYAYLLKNKNKAKVTVNKKMVEKALSSYVIFNYFINTCATEYEIYNDIGTGDITYEPYQPLADFFFINPDNKELLISYLKKEKVIENDEKKELNRI